MDMDVNDEFETKISNNYSSIIKYWSIKSCESEDFKEYKKIFSSALKYKDAENYKMSKAFFEKSFAIAKSIGDLPGVIESATELMNIARVLENPKFIQEVDQKSDEIFKDFDEISDEDSSLIHGSAGNIALSRLSIREEYYEHAEFFLLQALAKMKTLGFGENIAMCYRLLWNLALISSDFTKSEVWLLKSLEVYQTLGDKSAMTEMCKEVHAGGAVPPEQAVKMKDCIQSFIATGSTEISA